jgi:hypothetical protein
MKSLTRKQAKEWCRTQRIPTSSFGAPSTDGLRTRFQIPSSRIERRSLAGLHLKAFASEPRSLVWITEWGVWPSIDLTDDFIALRSAAGESRHLEEIPAQLVSQSDFGYLCAVVSMALESLWDIHIIGVRGRKRLFYSHDEWGGAQGISTQGEPAAS